MTVTQTVEIPESRRLIIDVPREVPTGAAILSFTLQEIPAEERPQERVFGCSKGKYRMADDFDAPLDDFKDYM